MKNMNKTFRKIGTAIMGLALVAGLSTSCSNGDWEDSLQGGTANGGNNGKISVYFSMQAPIRVITLGNDDDAVNTDDNAHQFKLQATWASRYRICKRQPTRTRRDRTRPYRESKALR